MLVRAVQYLEQRRNSLLVMDDNRAIVMQDVNMASWKAEEDAWRLIQAARWLDSMVGPLNLGKEPSKHEFLSCLRNGLVLCNTINRIVPGCVTKVVENAMSCVQLDAQPLPAYQYFENVRNFLNAMEGLNLPTFQASDLDEDDVGTASKLVDSILALKCYYEWKVLSKSRNGQLNFEKSPARRPFSALQSQVQAARLSTLKPSRQLSLSSVFVKELSNGTDQMQSTSNESIETLVKTIVDSMLDSKENFDKDILDCLRTKNPNEIAKIVSGYLRDQCGSFGPIKAKSNQSRLCEAQVKEVADLKQLFLSTKLEFTALQNQMKNDLNQLGKQIVFMITAARSYKQVVEDNRNLYNTLQDLKGNIRVYCRIRPSFEAGAHSSVSFIGDDDSMIVTDLVTRESVTSKVFQFDKIFSPSSTQEEVFSYTKPLIRSVMDGYNVCILAYGQTGSGKTYTMCGSSTEPYKDEGINFLAFNELFDISAQRKDLMNYDIKVQMVEIYNDQVRDLLADDGSVIELEISTSTSIGNLCLQDANVYLVESTADILNLMRLGDKNRALSLTAVDDSRSRCHSILLVHVRGRDEDGNELNSCLYLVDLAGSEWAARSEEVGDRLKQAQYINPSLSCLGDVIAALSHKDSHIPYRNSKLTQILQNSLGGQAKMLMIVHLNPEAEFYLETLNTLKFAQRVSAVELGAARLNKESSDIQKLRDQVTDLTKELSKTNGRKTNEKDLRSPSCTSMNGRITPPRRRRFSIEGQTFGKALTIAEQTTNPVVVSSIKRNRRLSLEGSKYQMKSPTGGRKNLIPGRVNVSLVGATIANSEPETNSSFCTPKEVFNNNSVGPKKLAITDQSRVKIDGGVGTANRPKSPATTLSAEFSQGQGQPQSSGARKGSQLKKSFLNFGKLISGPERSGRSTIDGTINNCDVGKLSSKNSKTIRRQSITVPQMSAIQTSRRSSVGGIRNDRDDGKFLRSGQNEIKTSTIDGIRNECDDGRFSSKNSKTTRRQSLTVPYASASQTSKRASLGGKHDPTPKTPPAGMPFYKTARRFL